MNVALYELLEKLESLTPEQIQALTPAQRQTLKEINLQLQLYLLHRIERRMTVNEKDDHFWKDLGKTFLGL